jgi:hypothetical protein
MAKSKIQLVYVYFCINGFIWNIGIINSVKSAFTELVIFWNGVGNIWAREAFVNHYCGNWR